MYQVADEAGDVDGGQDLVVRVEDRRVALRAAT